MEYRLTGGFFQLRYRTFVSYLEAAEDWIGFGIALLYESLMEDTPIQARAFQDRRLAGEWLGVPPDVLSLKDDPIPDHRLVWNSKLNGASA
jgi:hypothetical protein